MPRVHFSGAEVAAHRNFLIGQGVDFLALNLGSYLKQRQPLELRDVYDGFDLVLYTSDSEVDPDKVNTFVEKNGDRFGMIYDIRTDHDAYVPEWAGTNVSDFYKMAEGLQRVGVSEVVALDDKMMPFVIAFARRNDIELVVNSSKSDVLRHAWSDVILGGWLASLKHRELQVWDGHHVSRYSKANRQAGAERHWHQIERLGVSPQEIIEDVPSALSACSVQSWLHYGRSGSRVVAIDALRMVSGGVHEDAVGVATVPLQPRNRDRVTIPVLTRELLPALAEGGEELWSPYKVSSRPLRSCSGCNLSAHCPGFEDGASCAFEIPIRITTKAELLQAQSALLEMQMQRISFGRLQEDLLSQGLDSIVSQEMERFMRMVEAMQRSSQVTESVTITRKAEAGAISRLFGTEVGDAQLRLANPMTPNELNESIMDADILDDIPPPPP